MTQSSSETATPSATTKVAVARPRVARKLTASKTAVKVPAVKVPVTKTAVKAVVKPAVKKPAVKTPVKAVIPPTEAPVVKSKKIKLVRDSFTMPEPEYVVLAAMKKICIKAGVDIKKTELLRVAIKQLEVMSPQQISKVQSELIKVSAGRPKN